MDGTMNYLDEIRNYYMNPKRYPNSKKTEVENVIKRIDGYLLQRDQAGKGEFEKLCEKYTTEESSAPINTIIRQSRADQQGYSATRGYKDIYFNEVIQNANDSTYGTEIRVNVAKDENTYTVRFEYEDKGFSTENIIGFFNSEIHTKRENLAATGKHGVGIKALFYFVDELKIQSNIKAEFIVNTMEEDGIEKLDRVASKLSINEGWNKKTTVLSIKYRNKKDYGNFNVVKLNEFIDLIVDKHANNEQIMYNDVEKYFLGDDLSDLIFDCRALLFTDKNRNKQTGIKKIAFLCGDEEMFNFSVTLSPTEAVTISEYQLENAVLQFGTQPALTYFVVTNLSGDKNTQTFSVALPQANKIKMSGTRYYETYYIPEPETDSEGINVLVNGGYTSTDRRKLTADNEQEKQKILAEIQSQLVKIYKFLVSEECQKFITNEWRKEVSKFFHRYLLEDVAFVEFCFENGITNRYLIKYEKNDSEYDNRYLVYKRQEKEAYEKMILGQDWLVSDFVDFFNEKILQEDSIEYEPKLFMKEFQVLYEMAFQENSETKLKYILNIVGELKNLIKYRICGDAFAPDLLEKDIDKWLLTIADNDKSAKIALSIVGRYHLHSGVNANGEIIGASFYEYLFNDIDTLNVNGMFAKKQRELFNEQYAKLKSRLLDLLVNREKNGTVKIGNEKIDYGNGQVAFLVSNHHAASAAYYDPSHCIIYDYYQNRSNTQTFGEEFYELLLERFRLDQDIVRKHIKRLEDKIMLSGPEFPEGYSTKPYQNHLPTTNLNGITTSFINLNFMNDIIVHDFKKAINIIEYFTKNNGDWSKLFHMKLTANCPYEENCLKDLFELYYGSNVKGECSLKEISLTFEFEEYSKKQDFRSKGNLCPQDFCEFINKMLKVDISVMQVGAVGSKGKHEIVYLYKGRIYIWNNGEAVEIATVKNNRTNTLVILCNQNLDWKTAACKVLEKVYQGDVIEKCKAFLPNDQLFSIHGTEYASVTDRNHNGFERSVKYENTIEDRQNITTSQIKQIMTARGNNDNKCPCCRNLLSNQNLIITSNASTSTNSRYPQIIEVICDDCYRFLRKSHKQSKVIEESGNYYVEHTCRVLNTHQDKTVTWKYKVCDGVRALW